jgi:hypothetical protein
MKVFLYFVAFALLSGFTDADIKPLDGVWTGSYKINNAREKILVRFETPNSIELYNGEILQENKVTGTYTLEADTAILFTYSSGGQHFTMHGNFNRRKTYVSGIWKSDNKLTGSFYLRKERLTEMFVQP